MAKRKSRRGTPRETPQSGKTPNPGLPDPESVVSERVFVSPKGRRYRVLRTTEKDPYDPPGGEDKDDQGKKDNKNGK
jgi:hypothetical protein